jgi:hypothetical protein
MREDMPPPYWTPTGNSGEWRWIESDKKSSSSGWAWFDDDQSTLELPKYKKAIKRNWFKELFNFFLTKK